MASIWREPLLHFLIAGALIFVAFNYYDADERLSSDEIRVNQSALAQYLRHRDPRIDSATAIAALENMSAAERDSIVEQYVREEVLFRQAQALGLEQYDYSGRRRLIAQLDYINRGFLEDQLQFSDGELREYYDANKARYFEVPTITFTHVYFGSERHDQKDEELAAQKLAVLNKDGVPFHRGASEGDRFLYHKNYVDKGAQEIASHFGVGFAESVFALPASDTWIGPIASNYGYHVVMVTKQKAGVVPPLDVIRASVVSDLSAERIQAELDKYYQEARAAYDILIDLPAPNP